MFAVDPTKADLPPPIPSARTATEQSNGVESDTYHPIQEPFAPDPTVDTSIPGCFGAAPSWVGWLSAPFICCNVFTLNEKEHAAAMYCGRYVGSVQTPGLHFLPCLCLQLRKINTATRTMSMKGLKVVDSRGNPVMVSAVVTFEPTSAKKARIDVQNPWPNPSWANSHTITTDKGITLTSSRGAAAGAAFLQLQAEAVLKQITSQFPYEAPEGQPSLQTEGAHISHELISKLQARVLVTGAKILSFDLVDLSYAPEIAQAMLVRQQAAALVDARKLIVHAAVDMTTTAVNQLEEKMDRGDPLPDAVRNRLCTNLLTVVCSNEAVTPTIGVGNVESDMPR